MKPRQTGQLSLLLPIDGAAPVPAPATPAPIAEGAIDALFADWYAAYPRKRAPRHARRAFGRVMRDGHTTIEQLTEGVARYVEDCRRRGTPDHFILHPATFLNGGCWQNQYDAPALSATARSFSVAAAALGAARGHR